MTMRPILRFKLPALAVAAVLALGAVGGVSAQTALGVNGQSCVDAGFNNLGSSGQATCQVLAPSQLGYPQLLLITPTIPSGATPLQCSGVSGPGYSTQGTVSAFSPVADPSVAGFPACAFQVTSGLVPAGAPVGTELIGLPYYGAAASIQQTAALCGDPSCGTFSAFGPPPPPSFAAAQYSSFTPPPPPTFVTTTVTSSQPWWQGTQGNGRRDGDDRNNDGDHDRDDNGARARGDDGHGRHHGDR
jgi:hypothetical protein